MNDTVYSVLQKRGFIEQVSDEEGLNKALEQKIVCYAGFDPTADSLHVGHLLPIMALVQMQKHGHRPIVLLGGGTAMIGDPSGKTETRKILSREEVIQNTESIRQQFIRYLDFETQDGALLLNNATWLEPLTYITFLRDIGRHFSVNKMLAAESYRSRLATGLNFIEFNYMLLQAYDFLHLYQTQKCILQLGGNDQWGNILAGIDLIRRMHGGTAYGLTLPLITTASGTKMGKTEKGAIWLDPKKTSPYDYYQFWINTDDRDVKRFLLLFTLLSIDEIEKLMAIAEQEGWNAVKRVLAFEATALTHGYTAAQHAQESARSVFYGDGFYLDSLPSTIFSFDKIRGGIPAFILFADTGLCASRSDARRLIDEGGGYVNNQRLKSFDEKINTSHIKDGVILLRAGKKKYHRVIIK
ncbi:MAG: tyrosine--tRNA ligase [Desulfobacterota bacterium]|nr:tyrosine--tRNA ligase [Thermodesulfobacteriota bacterium]